MGACLFHSLFVSVRPTAALQLAWLLAALGILKGGKSGHVLHARPCHAVHCRVEWDQLQKAAGYAFEHPSISASGNANAMA